MTWPVSSVSEVVRLKADGLTDRAVSEATGVPIATIRTWRRRGAPGSTSSPRCLDCGGAQHDWESIPAAPYAYLLGVYLGDGTVGAWGRGRSLTIAQDVGYPGIVEECCQAIEAVRGRRPAVLPAGDKACVRIRSHWAAWPCLLPQHGSGRKHQRPIVLAGWQQRIVEAEPGPFVRGLIHSDGWRGVNRVRVKGRDYAYPRYQFSNRSDEIRALFTDACDRLGVSWRPWTRFHIAVSRAESVAILDRHVGLKA